MRTAEALIVTPFSRSRSIESSICSVHVAVGDGAGQLQQTVGQGGFAVVDMRDDAKIADVVGVHT